MIPPNPRNPEAKHLAAELEAKRERVRLRDGQIETIGTPLAPEEREWLLAFLKAAKSGAVAPRRVRWWR